MKKCPYCAEDIQDAAIVCKHCGRELEAIPPKLPKKKTSCAAWGCLGLLVFFGISLLLSFNRSLETAADTTLPLPTAGGDEAAKAELMKTSWVKDAHVSPGHMNIGVVRGEKDWTAPMIATFACGTLRRNGSTLSWVRFVDIEAVAKQGKSPQQAELHKQRCP